MFDVMSGEVAPTLPTVVVSTPRMRAGRLRPLTVGTNTRVNSPPEVPKMREAEIPGFESSFWGGVMAPAGTPASIVNRLHAGCARILGLPGIQERPSGLGATVSGAAPAEVASFLRYEIPKWEAVAKRVNIKLE